MNQTEKFISSLGKMHRNIGYLKKIIWQTRGSCSQGTVFVKHEGIRKYV
jgi:hypothetical protein